MKNTFESIYIIDDDGDDRQIIQDAFRQSGFNSEMALFENGNDVIDHMNALDLAKLPTLILLDLNMPGKNGRELLKEIKGIKNFRHIPIVVLTTSSYDQDRTHCYQLGANCFVTKPSSFDQLLERIQSISRLWLSETVVKAAS